MTLEQGDITALLRSWGRGDEAAFEELVGEVYEELRRLAAQCFVRERRVDHTLQPTALVHEAFLRLRRSSLNDWKNREQFFAIAATSMRRILVDHARGRLAEKRGGGEATFPLLESAGLRIERAPELIALDDALDALRKSDPQKALLVDLRFFGGLTVEQTAAVMECSRATVLREFRMARAWLHLQLDADPEGTRQR